MVHNDAVAGIVPFTDNFDDLSNLNGYQFEFRCERCGNGYRSPYQANIKERGKGLLRMASSLFDSAGIDRISNAAESLQYDRGTNSKQKDKALAEAVEAVRDHFRQCRGCGNWVCVDVCWNHDIGQCGNCSPFVAEEVSRAQAAAQLEQIKEKARETDWTESLDMATRAKVTCGSCNAKVEGGKFCPECGEKLTKTSFCSECGAKLNEGVKFCSECGSKQ